LITKPETRTLIEIETEDRVGCSTPFPERHGTRRGHRRAKIARKKGAAIDSLRARTGWEKITDDRQKDVE
jgi:hypothetical protein